MNVSTTFFSSASNFPFHTGNIYLFKVSNRNTRKIYEICSKLTIKTPERRQRHRSSVFVVNFEYISRLFLVYLLLTLNKYVLAGMCIEHTWIYKINWQILTTKVINTCFLNKYQKTFNPCFHWDSWTCIATNQQNINVKGIQLLKSTRSGLGAGLSTKGICVQKYPHGRLRF